MRAAPIWSVMIPAYDCADLLEHALASVLAQDPGPDVMQIEVIDDASSRDDPAGVVDRLARGRVRLFRHATNLGHAHTFNTCVQRAAGRHVHILHADDRVRPGFYAALGAALEAEPRIGAAFCRQAYVAEDGTQTALSPLARSTAGVLEDALERFTAGAAVQASSVVVRRAVYRQVGGFDTRFTACAEDWEMWVRIAARYPVWFEPRPLAEYRSSGGSLSARSIPSGRYVHDLGLAVALARQHFPADRRRRLESSSRLTFARVALNSARLLWQQGQPRSALVQMRGAARLTRSPRILPHFAAATLSAATWLLNAWRTDRD
jgi:hypothetical protein